MSQPAQPVSLASRLLKVERKIEAYQELHADELAELWQELNECKRQIVVGVPDESPGPNIALMDQAEGDRDERQT